MSEKTFNLLLIVSAAIYLYFGLRIKVPFANDPLGPRAMPLALGGGLLLLSLFRYFSRNVGRLYLPKNVARVIIAILFYLVSFQFLGFMLSTTITVYIIARLVGASWMEGALTGLVAAIAFYGIFYFGLGVGLPLGNIFGILG